MMKQTSILLFLSAVFFLIACNRDQDNLITDIVVDDCLSIESALIDNDKEALVEVLDNWLEPMSPIPTNDDNLGHEENLNTLIDLLEDCPNLTASLICYACIETLPLISEINLVVKSNDVEVEKIIDILTPEGENMRVTGWH